MFKGWILVLVILAMTGGVIAGAYILNHYRSNGSGGVCIVGSNACLSSYNLGWFTLPLLGRIHLSWIALGYFLLLTILFAFLWSSWDPRVFKVSLTLLTIGTLLIPYLAYLQISKLNSICFYCTSMYIVITVSLFIALKLWRQGY